jgi:hypothetical protein
MARGDCSRTARRRASFSRTDPTSSICGTGRCDSRRPATTPEPRSVQGQNRRDPLVGFRGDAAVGRLGDGGKVPRTVLSSCTMTGAGKYLFDHLIGPGKQ